MHDVYLNPLTDFGFKKLFGEEPNKDLLISFLNTLLPAQHQILDLTYTKTEYQGGSSSDRKAIFDLNCISQSGERFIVELQRVKQTYFKDRSIYYSSFAIQEQAQRGDWNYKLAAVYTIGILDFLMDNGEDVFYHAQLKDQKNRLFYDKLNFIYLVLPRFTLQQHELKTLQDKWLYVFKHLPELDSIPAELNEAVFQRLFLVAQIAPEDRFYYESSLKDYRDFRNSHDTSREEGWRGGLEQGIEQGKQAKARELAQRLLALGNLPDVQIAELVGVSVSEVQALKKLDGYDGSQ